MYSSNYLQSFYNGLKQTKFFHKHKEVHADVFFEHIQQALKEVNEIGAKLFFIGNGASASFSNHMALDWSKNGKILSHSLSDSSLLTALGNDFSFDEIFSEHLKISKFRKEDILFSTSSSGNSLNVINAIKYANYIGGITIALSGLKESNSSISLAKFSIFTPFKTYGMVECAHQYFHHLILDNYMGIEEWNREDYQDMNSSNFKL
jgi:D-sedoheptulose 7-phosphate isomerase